MDMVWTQRRRQGIAGMGERLTDKLIKALQAPSTGSKIYYDDEVKGLGVRVTAASAKAFILRYRIGGRGRLFTIGSFPDWSTTAARDEAKTLKRRSTAARTRWANATNSEARPTIGCLCDRYLSEHVAAHNKASTAAEVRRLVEKQIRPALGKLKISDFTRAEVKAWHSARSATPTTANRALAALSKLMNLAVHEWELCIDNPCKGIKRFPERKRERYFSDSELQRIGDVLAALEREEAVFPGCIIAVRLLALTGMRLGEVLGLRWQWIDLDAAILALPRRKPAPVPWA